MKFVFLLCSILALFNSNAYAVKPVPKRLCEVFPHLQHYAAETSDAGAGCTWTFEGEDKLEAIISNRSKQEMIDFFKKDMDRNEQIMRDLGYHVEREWINACSGGESFVADAGNGRGPGGFAYLIARDNVLHFSFNGDRGVQLFRDLAGKTCNMKYKDQ